MLSSTWSASVRDCSRGSISGEIATLDRRELQRTCKSCSRSRLIRVVVPIGGGLFRAAERFAPSRLPAARAELRLKNRHLEGQPPLASLVLRTGTSDLSLHLRRSFSFGPCIRTKRGPDRLGCTTLALVCARVGPMLHVGNRRPEVASSSSSRSRFFHKQKLKDYETRAYENR